MVQATIGGSGTSLASARGPPLGAPQRKGRDRGENRSASTHQVQPPPNGAVAFRAFQQLISAFESSDSLDSADPNISSALRNAKQALQSEPNIIPIPDEDDFKDPNESLPMSTEDLTQIQEEYNTIRDQMGTLPEVQTKMDGLIQRFVPRARRPSPYT